MENFRTTVSENGRIVIPAKLRDACEFMPGDELILRKENGGIYVTSAKQAVIRAQELVAKYVPEDVNLTDLLIALRKEDNSA